MDSWPPLSRDADFPRARSVFRAVAVVALLLSFAASISATQLAPPTEMRTVAVLLMMHVVAGISTIALFTTLARVPYDG